MTIKKRALELSQFQSSLTQLIELLSIGPSRSLTFTGQEARIHMHEDNQTFVWSVEDKLTAIDCLVSSGVYEPVETSILRELARECDIIVDCGANMGYYSVLFALETPAETKVLCFEPHSTTTALLRRNLSINGIENKALVIQKGLSDKCDVEQLYVPTDRGSSASSFVDLHQSGEIARESVQTITLDEFLHGFEDSQNRSVSLIKVDVEGAEKKVLLGADGTIRKHRPFVFCELLRIYCSKFGYHPNDVLTFFHQLNFSCLAIGNGPQAYLRSITEITESSEETNFIFVPIEKVHRLQNIAMELNYEWL